MSYEACLRRSRYRVGLLIRVSQQLIVMQATAVGCTLRVHLASSSALKHRTVLRTHYGVLSKFTRDSFHMHWVITQYFVPCLALSLLYLKLIIRHSTWWISISSGNSKQLTLHLFTWVGISYWSRIECHYTGRPASSNSPTIREWATYLVNSNLNSALCTWKDNYIISSM